MESIIVLIDPALEEEFAGEEGDREEADPNPHIDGAFLSEMLSFKGFRLEVKIFGFVVFFVSNISHPIGFRGRGIVLDLYNTCGLGRNLSEILVVIIGRCGQDPFRRLGGMGEMIIMCVLKSDLSCILFIAFIDRGVVPPVVDFFVMATAESHFRKEVEASRSEVSY